MATTAARVNDENHDADYAPAATTKKATTASRKKAATGAATKKKVGGAATKKKAAASRTPLSPVTNALETPEKFLDDDERNGKSIEQTYQKLSQLEHILLRPDTYVGSIERQQQPVWVLKDNPTLCASAMVEEEEDQALDLSFEYRGIEFVPGLYKIFDEILVNACDHSVRDASMKNLRVDFDEENETVRVFNDGKGIPVEMHKVSFDLHLYLLLLVLVLLSVSVSLFFSYFFFVLLTIQLFFLLLLSLGRTREYTCLN